ncbi:neuropeptide receptor A16 [Bombyx mori]|uniref:Neuropeptide receptor A16 n=1 Tax=Bombyx mori TaxID=7091 RepID=B3XXM9_BOMMO|nr:neuropeptide receptor A16 [Bombyx mori]BAG68415.1 neuropeptide receptor A16 [Bombyx mori]
MTTVEDDLNVPKKMKANKIISEHDDRFKTDTNSSEFEEAENETCVGDPQYCNMTKEEYVKMIQEYIYPNPYEWILIATHTFVFITGLFGNALVCVAVYRNHSMRTVTNYFIVNLAVADFMVILFCLPATVLWDVTETWFLGEGLCKVLPYFQSVSVTVSVLTLTFISVDRWYAICFPLKFKSTTGRAKTAILIIWLVSLCFNIPELVVLKLVRFVPLRFELPYLLQCYGTWSPSSELVWHILKVLLIYTLPLVLMAVAYHQIARVLWSSNGIPGQADTKKLATAELTQLRSRRKAAKMLVSVVIMFAVCYFPVHLLSVMRYTIDMGQTEFITIWALVSHVMCYANSAINPLIYNLMSDKFRREFRRAFCCSTSPGQQDFTSMSRVTTKKDSSIMASFKPGHTSTTFVHNNKNGHMT